MDTSKKIIRGVVNSRGFTITSPITQWDYGWQFIPEIEDLPATYRLDFSNEEKHGTALPVYCSTEGAEVPTELIDTGKDVWVWFFNIGEGYGITEYKWKVPNKCKPKTEQDEPTPSQQSSIDQLIVRSNEAVETAEQKAEEADQSAQSAKEDADRAEQARDDASTFAQRSANSAQASADYSESAQASATASAQSAQSASQSAQTASEKADAITGLTAQATTLPDGSSATASYDAETGVMSFGIPKGKDGTNGIDGDDGYSPTVTVTPITGGHRITITDKDGEHSADVMDGTGNVDDVQINGSSIVVDGVADIPMPQTITVSGTTPTITAQADYRYVCGEVATLDFTPPPSGICDVVFTSGSTPTVVTLPSTVKFPDGELTIEADTTYEINILDGVYGAVMSWT